ncbi:UDP-glycosyltransferase 73C4-like [Punica granatum]|uniref:Glycosyltransferase n=1 Tax=Punica granatum TaxID=22663 RepID=A0A6P8DUR9_PUNGR|nr:UDP-glycosyltransferase 73C4-like [Punica granatum]
MKMASSSSGYESLHFVLLPHLAHGHSIPMMDMARLLARRGPTVTVITTHLNAVRSQSTIDRAATSGLKVRLLEVPFPSSEAGLPEGCESMDSLPNRDLLKNLLLGIRMLREPVEELFGQLQPRPSCVIADKNIMWAHETAGKFGIPRIVFDGTSCFSLLCTHRIVESKVYETVPEAEPFVVPGLPDRIALTRAQLPGAVNIGQTDTKDVRDEIRSKELAAYGVVANTFEELEPAYVEEFRKVRGRVWCVGPVSLVNENGLDKAERGNRAAIDESHCLKWLDSRGPKSVIYACLGSLSRLTPLQLIEMGLGLEASNRPFIWVVRGGQEFEDWVSESRFEDWTAGRGLLVRGWAPQVLILSHPAVGGFLTHCGWNSTLEGVCAGVPMVTWPMFAEQFYNEKMIVQVLRVGVSLGSEVAIKWGEEEKFGAVMKKETVEKAIKEVMDEEEEEARGRRRRAMELGQKAKKAMDEGGSSYLNLNLLIEDIKQQVMGR